MRLTVRSDDCILDARLDLQVCCNVGWLGEAKSVLEWKLAESQVFIVSCRV